ncbi:MAG: formylmethanofuran dehydrogenase subunit B [Synergistaceae bacterium]|nr:formylmethanofuran dehydrogenase subunit B [Synergistaceae bacterium]MBP9957465.1 formylmethanofuran dehydrogenase subunit B [Synergistaceae bacterium]
MNQENNSRTENNGVCTFCGCLCDDISVDIEENQITKIRGTCSNGRTMFENYSSKPLLPKLNGDEISWDEAIKAAGTLLKNSKSPLIYGFSSSSSEAQRVAVHLGDILGATMDTTSSVCHGPTGLAMQAVGESSCTLGEVKNRGDLLIFWGCNPAASHSRHLSRYSLMPKGRYIQQGRKDRRMIVVDVRPTSSSKAADLFLQVTQGMDYDVLHAMRYILKGGSIKSSVGGVSPELLTQVVDEMKSCKYGVAFMGMGLTMTRGRDMNVRELFSLITDLNAHTRFSVIPMRGHGNVTGADQVFTWQTGFPFAVNLSRGYPRYGPGEFTAVDMLANGETDAALILSSDPAAHFPRAAVESMKKIPTIVMDPEESLSAQMATLWFPVAKCGIDSPGTCYRMDTMPIFAKALIPASRMSDEEVLRRIILEVA